jgi:hypothetical protein
MNKGKFIFPALVFALIGVNQARASGHDEIDLRCRSPSQSIVHAIGNYSYTGVADQYNWLYGHQLIGYMDEGYVDVIYRDVKPYVLRDDIFKANPNYYRTGMSDSDSEGWLIFGNIGGIEYPPLQYHQYATPTTSKNSAVTGTYYGQIKLTYKRYDGTTGEKTINVQIQKRECEAYNNGKWREVSPGRWEQR